MTDSIIESAVGGPAVDESPGAGAPVPPSANGDGAGNVAGAQGAAVGSHMTHRQIMIVMSGLMLGLFLAAIDQTIISTALPVIVGHLGGLRYISWVVAAYLLTSTVTTPLYGKISDLYGRKGVFQFAIVIFLVGSVLCGLSQNIWELIAFRAVQGLGGGGLMALAMAIMGDMVSPRERGRYQGYFGAVFGLATIVGPLIGGFLVDQLSWRWVFYINLPIGIVALIVTSSVLKLDFVRRERSIDYMGAALISVSVSALLLVTVWGGTQYAWSSPIILGLLAGGVVMTLITVFWESRATEPILPLWLFRNRNFVVSSAVTFILAVTMFGAVIYLPVYFQLVRGDSPIVAGLMLVPIMLGMMTTSTATGIAVSKIGRYKIFPIVGCCIMAVALWFMGGLSMHMSMVGLCWKMVLLGFGIGLIMQIMVIATQNSVDPADLGVATSANRFFSTLGGAFGTALLGAILTARLDYWIPRLAPSNLASKITGHVAQLVNSPGQVAKLPAPLRTAVRESFVRGLNTEFLVAVPFALAALVLTIILKEVPLRTTASVTTQKPESAEAPPS